MLSQIPPHELPPERPRLGLSLKILDPHSRTGLRREDQDFLLIPGPQRRGKHSTRLVGAEKLAGPPSEWGWVLTLFSSWVQQVSAMTGPSSLWQMAPSGTPSYGLKKADVRMAIGPCWGPLSSLYIKAASTKPPVTWPVHGQQKKAQVQKGMWDPHRITDMCTHLQLSLTPPWRDRQWGRGGPLAD